MSMNSVFKWPCTALLSVLGFTLVKPALSEEISIQSQYPPLQFTDASPGGAHPVGGPTKAFVDHANTILSPVGITFKMHVTGKVHPMDAALGIEPPLVSRKEFGTLHNAVMMGKANGGLDAAAGLPANSNLSFGEMMSGGSPFGLEVDELMAFMYAGGGLELMQSFYDETFGGKIKVLPIGMTSAQGAGYFQEPLPDPDTNSNLTREAAMKQICERPIIVRWPDGGAGIWAEACKRVGVETKSTGTETRCEDSAAICNPQSNPDNEVIHTPTALTFGGFAPGVSPHVMFANGNIDSFELNLPNNDVQFFKLAKKLEDKPNDSVDLSDLVPAYGYLGAWHQPTLFVELLLNMDMWNGMSDGEQALIEAAAKSSVVTTLANRLERQGDAVALLQKNGVTYLRWPTGLIELLREAAPYAQESAAQAATDEGDDTLARLYAAMSTYRDKQAIYSDFGDINQGQSDSPTYP